MSVSENFMVRGGKQPEAVIVFSFFSPVAPDLGPGLALHPEDALPPDPAHDLSQQTTRGTGKLSVQKSVIH